MTATGATTGRGAPLIIDAAAGTNGRARASDPVIRVEDLAWVEMEKPDLDAAERFTHAFGFATAVRTPQELHLRGTLPGPACLIIRRGRRARFVAPVYRASSRTDLERLARALDGAVRPLAGPGGGYGIDVHDPSGSLVRVVAEVEELPALAEQQALTLNVGTRADRINAVQRPPHEAARVQRLGHVELETTRFRRTLDWYLENLGLIVSDYLFLRGQRDRGPVMAFARCDRGRIATDHHTLALYLGPRERLAHTAYQVSDLDAIAMGAGYLAGSGGAHVWGIGRHVEGSAVFNFWRDPDGFLFEHYSDGDRFDDTVRPDWAPMQASRLTQWGPPPTAGYLGSRPSLSLFRAVLAALREKDNDIDLRRLLGLARVTIS
ncbi:VOC family protein [Rhodococcus daqingensis]|uniref:VOC family protein n=1 Tax=Rhodococcus daqingensis TaxID=2479363 RepID=A0ABW2S064_9NOCA